jgi:hypothetical protein
LKLRILQILFVAVALLCAAAMIHRSQAHLLVASQAQQTHIADVHPASIAQRKAVIASVQAQLLACRQGDFKTALKYRSRMLAIQFPSGAAFQHMLKSHYPAFLHFQSVAFGQVEEVTSRRMMYVPLRLQLPHASPVNAVYEMTYEDGMYKVAGVEGGVTFPKTPTPSAMI